MECQLGMLFDKVNRALRNINIYSKQDERKTGNVQWTGSYQT